MSKKDIYICGDVNIDIMVPNTFSLPEKGQELVIDNIYSFIGGGAALTALGLSKLGASVDFESVVADDLYGNYIKDELQKAGVDIEHLRFSNENRTGISLSFTDKEDRCFVTYRGTNAEINLNSISVENAKNSDFIHITGYGGKKKHSEYLKLVKKLKEEGLKISFDLGWDDTDEWYEGIAELFEYIDLLFMNETEILHYSRKGSVEEGMQAFARQGMIIVIKRGANGASAFFDNEIISVKGLKVNAVDTTGAGDSFNAGVLYGILSGCDIKTAVTYGNICGAYSTTKYGGNAGFPNKKELIEKAREINGG